MGKILTKNPAMTYVVLVNMGLNKLETYEIIGFFSAFCFQNMITPSWGSLSNNTKHLKNNTH